MKLKSKTAIITGAASGIGKAIALRFGQEGANVIISDKDMERAKSVVKEIESAAGKAVAREVDVTDCLSVEDMVNYTVERYGRIDILVNNAGISWVKPFFEVSNEDWDLMIKTHLYGCFFCSQAVARVMIRRNTGGKILNISSITGLRGSLGRGPYGAAKGGIITFTKYLAVELAQYRINVNSIAPGPIFTPLIEKIWEKVKDYPKDVPLKRFGTPDEVADAALFLCSSAADYITGAILPVDGGFLAAGQIDRNMP
jgi:NAD(P)-dependent dehydrogenase (short-subunit alcohol dehydrogenase family)